MGFVAFVGGVLGLTVSVGWAKGCLSFSVLTCFVEISLGFVGYVAVSWFCVRLVCHFASFLILLLWCLLGLGGLDWVVFGVCGVICAVSGVNFGFSWCGFRGFRGVYFRGLVFSR